MSTHRTDQIEQSDDEELVDHYDEFSRQRDELLMQSGAGAWPLISEGLGAAESQAEYEFGRDNPFYSPGEPQCSEEEVQSQYSLGVAAYWAGDVPAAIRRFEAGLQKARGLGDSPADSDSWRMLGVCHADNDEDLRAIQCLQRATSADPYNAAAFLALGLLT